MPDEISIDMALKVLRKRRCTMLENICNSIKADYVEIEKYKDRVNELLSEIENLNEEEI